MNILNALNSLDFVRAQTVNRFIRILIILLSKMNNTKGNYAKNGVYFLLKNQYQSFRFNYRFAH